MASFKKITSKAKGNIKKGIGSVTPFLDPLGLMRKGEGVLFGKPGKPNPFGTPDPNQLFDISQFDFLKEKPQTNQYAANLPANIRRFSNYYQPPEDRSEGLFKDLVGNIGAPSSTDDVRREVEGQRLTSLLSDVDADTKQAAGRLKSDLAEAGLLGPGVGSEIASTGLAQTYSDAARTRGNVRSAFAEKELDRLKAREEALRGAYGQRYTGGLQTAQQERDIASRGAMSDVDAINRAVLGQADLEERSIGRGEDRKRMLAEIMRSLILGKAGSAEDLYKFGEQRKLATGKKGLFETILDSFGGSFGSSLGESLGGKGGEGIFRALAMGG